MRIVQNGKIIAKDSLPFAPAEERSVLLNAAALQGCKNLCYKPAGDGVVKDHIHLAALYRGCANLCNSPLQSSLRATLQFQILKAGGIIAPEAVIYGAVAPIYAALCGNAKLRRVCLPFKTLTICNICVLCRVLIGAFNIYKALVAANNLLKGILCHPYLLLCGETLYGTVV